MKKLDDESTPILPLPPDAPPLAPSLSISRPRNCGIQSDCKVPTSSRVTCRISGRAQLLDQIRAGKTLRKTEGHPAAIDIGGAYLAEGMRICTNQALTTSCTNGSIRSNKRNNPRCGCEQFPGVLDSGKNSVATALGRAQNDALSWKPPSSHSTTAFGNALPTRPAINTRGSSTRTLSPCSTQSPSTFQNSYSAQVGVLRKGWLTKSAASKGGQYCR